MIDASSSEAKTCNNWVVEKPPFREAPVGTTPKPMHRPVLEACLSLSLEGFGRRAPSLSPALDGSGGQKSLGERVALSIDVRMKSEFGSSSQIFEMWYGATYEGQVFPWCICLQISWPCLVPPEIRPREIDQMVWGVPAWAHSVADSYFGVGEQCGSTRGGLLSGVCNSKYVRTS